MRALNNSTNEVLYRKAICWTKDRQHQTIDQKTADYDLMQRLILRNAKHIAKDSRDETTVCVTIDTEGLDIPKLKITQIGICIHVLGTPESEMDVTLYIVDEGKPKSPKSLPGIKEVNIKEWQIFGTLKGVFDKLRAKFGQIVLVGHNLRVDLRRIYSVSQFLPPSPVGDECKEIDTEQLYLALTDSDRGGNLDTVLGYLNVIYDLLCRHNSGNDAQLTGVAAVRLIACVFKRLNRPVPVSKKLAVEPSTMPQTMNGDKVASATPSDGQTHPRKRRFVEVEKDGDVTSSAETAVALESSEENNGMRNDVDGSVSEKVDGESNDENRRKRVKGITAPTDVGCI